MSSISKSYGRRELQRRYIYRRWMLHTERAEWRTISSRKYRHHADRLLRTATDFDMLTLPPPPKTGGCLTW